MSNYGNLGYHPFSQNYYQSSSLASALTPVGPRADYPPSGYSQGSNNWHAEYRMHAQAIPRSASTMPERQMNHWNPSAGLRSESGSKYFPPENGPRRSATPGPQNSHQPLHARHAPIVLPPPVPRIPTAYNVKPGSQPVGSFGYPAYPPIAPRVVSGEPTPDVLYVGPNYQEADSTIYCPHSWCNSTFTRSNDLARHLATASSHRESAPEVDPSRKCHMCGEEFSRSDARHRHEVKRSCGKKRRAVRPT